MMNGFSITPGLRLLVAFFFIAIMAGIVTFTSVQQPASGLGFTVDGDKVFIASSQQPQIPLGAELISIGSNGKQSVHITANDFIEDPHYLPSYADMQAMFAKQSQLHTLLTQQDQLQLGLRLKPGQAVSYYPVEIAKTRSLSSMPAVFWFQLAVSSIGFLLGCWIWVLRPQELAARIFAILNTMYPVFAFAAAIYSTRDIALDGELLRALVVVNTAGASFYGCALMSLFLVYPKRLVPAGLLWLIPVFFAVWLVLDTLFLLPEPSMGGDLPVTIQMLSAIIFAVLQWYANRKDPRARAALKWFGACILISCGLFVFLVQSSQLLGLQSGMSQGYSFGFFLMVTVGIALGLRRYKLFELDQWAFGILFWLLGAIALIVLDTFLVVMLSPVMSLSLAVLICGLIWLPARGWIQQRFLSRRSVKDPELFQKIIAISFAVTEKERQEQWKNFLAQLFRPLNIELTSNISVDQVQIRDDGLCLYLPPVAGMPALLLEYHWQGRKLFSGKDASFVAQLLALVQRAADSRTAYDRGVQEERGRISRDLHDDIGSRLLSALYQKDISQTKQLVQQSLADMRTMLTGLSGNQLELELVLVSLRQETSQRLQEANIQLNWSSSPDDLAVLLNYSTYKHYSSMLRELVSNLIKYAEATQVEVRIEYTAGWLHTSIQDNGKGFDFNQAPATGHGMGNLKQRAATLSAKLYHVTVAQGTHVVIELPLNAMGDADTGSLHTGNA